MVPYDSGQHDVRMGAGPTALGRAGAAQLLRGQGHVVEERLLGPSSSWRAEVETAFEIQRLVAAEVMAARAARHVPILLSGNCNTSLGVLAGMTVEESRLGLVWLDAHGDFNTPDIDAGGFLDGHALAMIVGRCWQAVTSTVPGFRPLPENRVALIGARSLDKAEEPALRDSLIAWLPPADARDAGAVSHTAGNLTGKVDRVHIHVDLDVLDPAIAPANGYAVPDGLSAEEIHQVVHRVAEKIPICSATLASYDPGYDPHGRMERTALELLLLLARQAQPTSTLVAG